LFESFHVEKIESLLNSIKQYNLTPDYVDEQGIPILNIVFYYIQLLLKTCSDHINLLCENKISKSKERIRFYTKLFNSVFFFYVKNFYKSFSNKYKRLNPQLNFYKFIETELYQSSVYTGGKSKNPRLRKNRTKKKKI